MRALQILTTDVRIFKAAKKASCFAGIFAGVMLGGLRADIQQVGVFTFSSPTDFLPGSVFTPDGGVDIRLPLYSAFLTVTVPEGWAIGGSVIAGLVADYGGGESSSGVEGGMFGYDADGNQIWGDRDLGDWGNFGLACTDCGFSSEYHTPYFWFSFDGSGGIVPIRSIAVQEDAIFCCSGDVQPKYMRIVGGFDAVAPEPSALLLLATALALAWVVRRRWAPSSAIPR